MAKLSKADKPQVFDDKATGLRCLTLIVIIQTVAICFIAWKLPNGTNTAIIIAAMGNVVTGCTGGIIGVITGQRWSVKRRMASGGAVVTNVVNTDGIEEYMGTDAGKKTIEKAFNKKPPIDIS